MSSTYDAIIIGAGLGGLSAAALLTKHGKKVLVIEQHTKVGGFASNFKRNGFLFDVSLHNLGPLYDYPKFSDTLDELGVLDKLTYIPFTHFQKVLFPDFSWIVPKGIELIIKDLISKFPDQEDGIQKFFNYMKELSKEYDEIDSMEKSINELKISYPMFSVKFPMLVTCVEKTIGDILNTCISNERLKSLLGSFWWIYGLPPLQLAFILFAIPTTRYLEHAGGRLAGTSQILSNALKQQIERQNGKILLKTKVIRILMKEKRISGVETSDGQQYQASNVISNASAQSAILSMLPADSVKKAYRRRIEKARLSLSATQLFLGLNVEATSLGMDCAALSIFESYDHEENFRYACEGLFDKGSIFVTDASAYDKSLAPSGKSVLNLMMLDHINNWQNLDQTAYKEQKKQIIDILLNRLESIMPLIRNHIEIAELATPLTIQRYTGHPEGAIYGFSQCTEQSGVNRLPNQTPIKGLWLAGAYTYPGGGYSSVIDSGYRAAYEVLNQS